MRGVLILLVCLLGNSGCSSMSGGGAAGSGVDDAAGDVGARSDDAGTIAADASGGDATVGDETGGPEQDASGSESGASDASLYRDAPPGAVDAAVTVCRSSTDCPAGNSCIGPSGGGSCASTCPSIQCEGTECDAGVCRFSRPTATCSTFANTKFCMPPCQSDAECPGGMLCEQDGTCGQRLCQGGPCPANMTCHAVEYLTALCFANGCTADTGCPGAYCVNGTCETTLGFCAPSCD